MYVITIIRLNLGFALLVLSRYCFNSNSTHIYAITRVLRYVKETLHYDIHYERNKNLIDYTNVDFAKAIDDRRSIGE
jgi:hypothetical protein